MLLSSSLRDLLVFSAVFGFFAFVWFGWGQERPPDAWRKWLGIGAAVSVLVALGGGLLAWRSWQTPSALDAPAAFRLYLVTVAVEFWVSLGGAVYLAVKKRRKWIPVWICAVVGVHFLPLALVFSDLLLVVLALALVAVAVAARVANRRHHLEPSAVVGMGAGATLLLTALVYGVVALTSR